MIKILIYNFLISALGFGGGETFLMYIQNYYVQNGLVSNSDFSYYTSIAYALPGPLSVKVISLINYESNGVIGLLFGISILIIPTFFFSLIAYKFLSNSKIKSILSKVGIYITPMLFALILYFVFSFIYDNIVDGINVYILILTTLWSLFLYYYLKKKGILIMFFSNLIIVLTVLTISGILTK